MRSATPASRRRTAPSSANAPRPGSWPRGRSRQEVRAVESPGRLAQAAMEAKKRCSRPGHVPSSPAGNAAYLLRQATRHRRPAIRADFCSRRSAPWPNVHANPQGHPPRSRTPAPRRHRSRAGRDRCPRPPKDCSGACAETVIGRLAKAAASVLPLGSPNDDGHADRFRAASLTDHFGYISIFAPHAQQLERAVGVLFHTYAQCFRLTQPSWSQPPHEADPKYTSAASYTPLRRAWRCSRPLLDAASSTQPMRGQDTTSPSCPCRASSAAKRHPVRQYMRRAKFAVETRIKNVDDIIRAYCSVCRRRSNACPNRDWPGGGPMSYAVSPSRAQWRGITP